MKTKTLLVTFLSAVVLLTAVSVASQADAAQTYAYANAYSYSNAYSYPGNSLYGRMHNPHFFYKWGNHSFGSIEEAINFARNNMYQSLNKHGKKITWIETGNRYSTADVDVTTRPATGIDEDGATLRGTVDLNDEEDALVWFEYGTSPSYLSERTSKTAIDEDDDEDFSKAVTGLDSDTRYYYRAVIENDSDREYGSLLSFFTEDDDDSDSEEDTPEAKTLTADSIDEDSADIRGSVNMNDYKNGTVFFVYGEDEDMVEDVDDEDTFEGIDEEGEDVATFRVDSDLDKSGTYIGELRGLDEDTVYYYRIGVEYEDDDDNETLELGSVRNFRTD
ncbi:TPA: hypothetical protein DEP58_01335 [Patescibacteria group bacterium]|nr:MAG: hypothetical protein UU98_C0019G0012 [Parcubacteria group bacterium GW2011_GWD2_42_14]HCC04932.1 hypothetical protein [Patescibacteria group bacterium]